MSDDLILYYTGKTTDQLFASAESARAKGVIIIAEVNALADKCAKGEINILDYLFGAEAIANTMRAEALACKVPATLYDANTQRLINAIANSHGLQTFCQHTN